MQAGAAEAHVEVDHVVAGLDMPGVVREQFFADVVVDRGQGAERVRGQGRTWVVPFRRMTTFSSTTGRRGHAAYISNVRPR